jgi:uncharacterized protein (TIGR03435 family)
VKRLVFAAICLTSLTEIPGFAETPEATPRFELAAVRPSAHTTGWDAREVSGGLMRGGTYRLRHATMLDLVRIAYGVDAKKVLGGPNWLEMDRFDVRAKVPAGTTAETVKPMLRALLAERFGLVAHNDTKPVAAWALMAGKHLLLKQSDGSGESRCQSGGAEEFIEVTCRNTTMEALVSNLGKIDGAWYYLTDNLVVDQTGLEGAWDFDFKYSRRWTATAPGSQIVSLFDALEKFGLKLDPSMVSMPVVVVDSVNRTPTANSPAVDKAFPPLPTEFEVADVKPSPPDYHGDDFQMEANGRVNVRGTTLRSLIADAWGITGEMIVGAPRFVDSDRWDIVAKAPEAMAADGDADADSLMSMFRTLLAERFRLAAHYEERPMPAYAMTASKPKLKKADPASRSGCKEGPPTLARVEPRSTNPVLGRLFTCTNVSMAYFAQELPYLASGYIHSDVLDATGLEGGWDFTLSFSKAAQFRGNDGSAAGGTASEPTGALSAPEAMEKQLGLKMELRKRPVRVLVIDHIEEKPTDN